MALIKISQEEAFKMLMSQETEDKVYYKSRDGYLKAVDYKWIFGEGGGLKFRETDFYKEVEG
mgnify:FL=1